MKKFNNICFITVTVVAVASFLLTLIKLMQAIVWYTQTTQQNKVELSLYLKLCLLGVICNLLVLVILYIIDTVKTYKELLQYKNSLIETKDNYIEFLSQKVYNLKYHNETSTSIEVKEEEIDV